MPDFPLQPRPQPVREEVHSYGSREGEKPLPHAGLIIALILLGGALIRAAAVWYFSHVHYQYPDEDLYWELGQRLLSGKGISLEHDAFGGYVRANEPTAYFGALMAPVCAFLRIISFGHISVARLILGEFAWFGTAIPMFLYARKKVRIGTGVMLLIALALFPNLHFFGSFVMTENILIPLVCTALYLGAAMQASPSECAFGLRKPWFVMWSLLYGFIHLIKMNLLLFQPIQFWIDTRKMPWKHKAIAAAIMIGCTGIVVAPWAWRNHTQMGTWALETKSGYNLWMMNNPARNKPLLKEDFVGPASTMPSFEGKTEAQCDAACKDLFLR